MNKKKVLSKFTILCWASFTAVLGHTSPGLDTPGGLKDAWSSFGSSQFRKVTHLENKKRLQLSLGAIYVKGFSDFLL